MKQLIDFIPLILFFVVYKMDPRMISLGAEQYEVVWWYDAVFP